MGGATSKRRRVVGSAAARWRQASGAAAAAGHASNDRSASDWLRKHRRNDDDDNNGSKRSQQKAAAADRRAGVENGAKVTAPHGTEPPSTNRSLKIAPPRSTQTIKLGHVIMAAIKIIRSATDRVEGPTANGRRRRWRVASKGGGGRDGPMRAKS